MDYLEMNEDVCRICLEDNVYLNWNDSISVSHKITYKDCYHKYTKLSESGFDTYITNLCEKCAVGLKNAHMLFEKALESFLILQVAGSDIEISDSELKMGCEIYASDEYIFEDDKALMETNDEICLSQEISMKRAHFSNIAKFESPLVQVTETINTGSLKSSATKDSPNKKNKSELHINSGKISRCKSPLEQQVTESVNITLLKALPTKNMHSVQSYSTKPTVNQTIGNGRLKCQYLNESQLEKHIGSSDSEFKKITDAKNISRELDYNCGTKSSVPSIPKRSKPREKLCQYCSLKVNGTNHLRAHEATHSENRERKETCPHCGIKLYNKLSLSEHMKTHSKNRRKNHKCEFCEKAFFNKGGLNVHRRIHLGLMVKCQICSKEYYRQIDLNKHLLIHSASPLQKSIEKLKYTVQCQYCNKTVLTNNWKQHKAAHLNQPQTKCKICDKNFFSRSSCTSHLRKVHRTREFDKFIYYYVDPYIRMSHLIMVQQEQVQSVTK